MNVTPPRRRNIDESFDTATLLNKDEQQGETDNSSNISSTSAIQLPLTPSSLRQLWDLTRSEWFAGSSLSHSTANTIGNGLSPLASSINASSLSSGFVVLPPPGWIEVQQHQRYRKNPQHYLRDDRHSTKSWHQQMDTTVSSSSSSMQQQQTTARHHHLFEMSIQAGLNVAHINLRIAFYPNSNGCPDVQVTVLRRLPITSVSNTNSINTPTKLSPGTLDELRSQVSYTNNLSNTTHSMLLIVPKIFIFQFFLF